MIGKLTVPMLALLLGACDRGMQEQQPPGEYEQMEPGMGEEVEAPDEAGQAMRSTLDRRLTAAQDWVTTRRQELTATGEEVSADLTQQLDELERRIQEVERNIEERGEQGFEAADRALTEIERDIQQLGTERPTDEEQKQQPFEEMEG